MKYERQLSSIHSVADFRTAARRALPRMVFDFADGGSESETTMRENRAAIDRLWLLPSAPVDVGQRKQSIELFGQKISMPIIIGPTGLASAFWPHGDEALAAAAGKARIPYVMSTNATSSLEAVQRSGDGRKWFQLYVCPTRPETATLMDRVRNAGFEALEVTVDTAVPSRRLRDLANGFSASIRWTPSKVIGVMSRPAWLMRTLRHGAPRPAVVDAHAQVDRTPGSEPQTVAPILNPATDWEDIAWIRDQWRGPLIIKGISDPRQAERAVSIGLDGIVVSNHGGRQLDGAVASIDVLPSIVAIASGRMTVLVDGGFRSGSDVLKALALGASAVQLGRASLYALATAGEAGVSHMLNILKMEIDVAQALLGLPDLAVIDRSILWNPPASSGERLRG